jgi:hypothetical protein
MTALLIASRLLGLLSASALLMCGAILLALSPWVPGLRWAAGVTLFVGMWSGR